MYFSTCEQSGNRKWKFDLLDFLNQGHKSWDSIGLSYLKIMLEPIRTQNLGSSLMKLSQSNFNLRSPDCYSVCSYLIATVTIDWMCKLKL